MAQDLKKLNLDSLVGKEVIVSHYNINTRQEIKHYVDEVSKVDEEGIHLKKYVIHKQTLGGHIYQIEVKETGKIVYENDFIKKLRNNFEEELKKGAYFYDPTVPGDIKTYLKN